LPAAVLFMEPLSHFAALRWKWSIYFSQRCSFVEQKKWTAHYVFMDPCEGKTSWKEFNICENCTESITLSFKASDRGNVHTIALWFYSWKTT